MKRIISKYALERAEYAHRYVCSAHDYAARKHHSRAAECYGRASQLFVDAVIVTSDDKIRAGFDRLAEHCTAERLKQLSKEEACLVKRQCSSKYS